MADAHVEEHSSPIKTPQQLIVVVVLSFLVPVLGIVMIAKSVTGGMKIDPKSAAMSEAAVAQRLKPVGEVLVEQSTSAPGSRGGEEVYNSACVACHGPGVLGAPKFGDAGVWKTRLAQGKKTLVSNAIKGLRQMPPRGGNAALTDSEVERAVIFMGNKSGGSL
ncbi:MAG: c-type cytochrome [Burkholderiales bacterium]